MEKNLKLEHDINSIACTTVTSPLILQYFDELELMVIVLFVVDDIDRNLKRKMQIILFDAKNFGEFVTNELSFQPHDANDNSSDNMITSFKGNGINNHNFCAMNNDFNYMDFDSFDTMTNKYIVVLVHHFHNNKHKNNRRVVNKKRIIKKIQEKAYNQNPKW